MDQQDQQDPQEQQDQWKGKYLSIPVHKQLFSLHDNEGIPHDELKASQKEAWRNWRDAQKKLSLRGQSILAFCRTTISPNCHHRAMMLTTLSLSFQQVPKLEELKVISTAMKLMFNLEDLTVTGLVDPEKEDDDAWILSLGECKFILRRFTTDVPIHSMNLLDFFDAQNGIEEMKLFKSNVIPGFLLPEGTLPHLQVLECPEFMMPCFARKCGALRPLRYVKLTLEAENMGEWGPAMHAVSRFEDTLEEFTADFSLKKGFEGFFDIPEIIDKFGKLGSWKKLRSLEFSGGHFDDASVIAFIQSIVNNFDTVGSLMWVPGSVDKNTPEWIARTLYKGSASLRHFRYMDPDAAAVNGARRCLKYCKWEEDDISKEEEWLIKNDVGA